MNGNTRQDTIRKKWILAKVRVAPILENMVESRLRWFGNVSRKSVEAPVRKVY